MRHYAFRPLNTRSRTQSCSHLFEMICLVSLQDQTDIRMGNNIPGPGDDISVAGLTHLDVPDNFPDVTKVEFSLEDTDNVSRKFLDGHSHREVRLRASNEINGTKKSGTLSCL